MHNSKDLLLQFYFLTQAVEHRAVHEHPSRVVGRIVDVAACHRLQGLAGVGREHHRLTIVGAGGHGLAPAPLRGAGRAGPFPVLHRGVEEHCGR